MQIWSENYYALHLGSVKIYKHCVYWNVFRKIIFNCLLLFKLFLLVSKLFEPNQQISQVFSDMLGILVLSFMDSSIPTFLYIFIIFHLVCELLKSLFSHILLVSKFYELILWILFSRNVSINLYLRPLVLLFMESSICTVCTYSGYILVRKMCKSGNYTSYFRQS